MGESQGLAVGVAGTKERAVAKCTCTARALVIGEALDAVELVLAVGKRWVCAIVAGEALAALASLGLAARSQRVQAVSVLGAMERAEVGLAPLRFITAIRIEQALKAGIEGDIADLARAIFDAIFVLVAGDAAMIDRVANLPLLAPLIALAGGLALVGLVAAEF